MTYQDSRLQNLCWFQELLVGSCIVGRHDSREGGGGKSDCPKYVESGAAIEASQMDRGRNFQVSRVKKKP